MTDDDGAPRHRLLRLGDDDDIPEMVLVIMRELWRDLNANPDRYPRGISLGQTRPWPSPTAPPDQPAPDA